MVDILLNLCRKDRECTVFEYKGEDYLLSSVPLLYDGGKCESQIFKVNDAEKFIRDFSADAIDYTGIWETQYKCSNGIHEMHKKIMSEVESLIDKEV